MSQRTKFFKSEIKKIKRLMEKMPFQMEIMKQGKKDIREGIRQEYDRIKEMVDAANVRIKAEQERKDKGNAEVIRNLQTMKNKYEPDMKKMEDQLNELDKEIGEVDPTLQVKVEAARSYIQLVNKLLKK